MSGASVQVEIDRLALGLRLAGEHERLEPVARRLCALAGGRLQDALAHLDLSAAMDAAETDELVFIERLAVDCSANTAWDDDAISQHLARRLALALQARAADARVLRFRDRADYVAAALVAFADGQASRCWWFDELVGLQHLSCSTAVRTLVISEEDSGVAALARLTDTTLTRVLGALGDGDGARLLAWLGRRSGDAAAPVEVLWLAAGTLPEHGGNTAWLRAIIAAEQAVAGGANAASLSCLRGLAALQRLARDGSLLPPATDARAWLHDVLLHHKLDVRWLAAASETSVTVLVTELTALTEAAPRRAATSARFGTREGGFFVLLGRLHGLGWMTIWQALARADLDMTLEQADTVCRALACEIAAQALAGTQAARVLRDSAVQTACAMPDAADCIAQHGGFACAALRTVLRGRAPDATRAHTARRTDRRIRPRALPRLLAEAAALLLAHFARALPGLAASSPGFLRSQALSMHASVCTSDDVTTVRLGPAPLNVLLVLAGVKRVRIALPGAAALQLLEDHGA